MLLSNLPHRVLCVLVVGVGLGGEGAQIQENVLRAKIFGINLALCF